MKGLFIKDIALMTQRSKSLLVLLFVIIIMTFTTEGGLIVSYVTLLGSILATSTLSYDEFDNGMPFLMSLPTGRKNYVKEKYMFCFAVGFCAWLLALAVSLVSGAFKGGSAGVSFEGMVSAVPVFVLIVSIMLPLNLKYGQERARIILLVVFMCFAAVAIVLTKVAPDLEAAEAQGAASGISDGVITVIIFAVMTAIAFGSYFLSQKIMKNKEF